MPELELLRPDHAPALLAFELANRAYFAAAVPDRGDDYFAAFDRHLGESLALQAAGIDLYHVLVEPDGAIVGRVNLFEVADGAADLGYRIAERATGQGLATAAVRAVIALAAGAYGLTELRAMARVENVGSRIVLERTGFTPVGEVELSGLPGIRYRLALPASRAD